MYLPLHGAVYWPVARHLTCTTAASAVALPLRIFFAQQLQLTPQLTFLAVPALGSYWLLPAVLAVVDTRLHARHVGWTATPPCLGHALPTTTDYLNIRNRFSVLPYGHRLPRGFTLATLYLVDSPPQLQHWLVPDHNTATLRWFTPRFTSC